MPAMSTSARWPPSSCRGARGAGAAGAGGHPQLPRPETCGDVIAAAFARRGPTVPDRRSRPRPAAVRPRRMLDEATAYELFSKVGIPHAPVVVLEAGAPVPDLPFSYPVVAKVLHPDIAHTPTRPRWVAWNWALRWRGAGRGGAAHPADGGGAQAGYRAVSRILVQPTDAGIGRGPCGLRRDPQDRPDHDAGSRRCFHRVVSRPQSPRLAPVDRDGALEMIAEVKAMQVLAGYRGKRKGDLSALADALVAVSQLAWSRESKRPRSTLCSFCRKARAGLLWMHWCSAATDVDRAYTGFSSPASPSPDTTTYSAAPTALRRMIDAIENQSNKKSH